MDNEDLKDYIDTRIDDARLDIEHRVLGAMRASEGIQRATDIQFDAVTKATDLAREAAEARLEGLNNSFKFIRESQAEYVPFAQHEALDKRISLLENGVANLQGRLWAIGVLVPLIIMVISIIVSIALRIYGQ